MTTLTSRPSAPHSAWVLPETRAALDAFFQGFGFTSDEDLSALALWVLDSDGAHGARPRDAVALARSRMEAWLAGVLGLEAGDMPFTRAARPSCCATAPGWARAC
ncbi:hypothetical protein ACLESO_36710 [Pyxidicoccus sp. 3LG]